MKANGLVVLNEVTVPANEIMYHLWSVRDLEPNGKVFTIHPSLMDGALGAVGSLCPGYAHHPRTSQV